MAKNKAHQRNLERARANRERSGGRRGKRKRRRWDIRQIGIAVLLGVLSLLLIVTFIPGFTGLLPGDDVADPLIDDVPDDDPFSPDEDLVACDGVVPDEAGEDKPQWDEPPEMVIDPEASYRAVFETSCGTIVIDLFADGSPQTVNNFVFLAREGFYDGVTFHRIANFPEDYVIQGGDPTGTGAGGPGYRFEDELALAAERGYPRGTVAMANAGPDTNGSQFFIVFGDASFLEPAYAVFGEVADGMEVVDEIGSVPTINEPPVRDQPVLTVYIHRVTIEELPPNDSEEEEDT